MSNMGVHTVLPKAAGHLPKKRTTTSQPLTADKERIILSLLVRCGTVEKCPIEVIVIFYPPHNFGQRIASAIKIPHKLGASCAEATPMNVRKHWAKRERGSLTPFHNICG